MSDYFNRSLAVGEQFPDDVSCDVGQSLTTPLVAIGQFLMIDAQQMQQGGMQVMDVRWLPGERERLPQQLHELHETS